MADLPNNKFVAGNAKVANHTFVNFPSAKVFSSSKSKDWVQHLLFGDYVQILDLKIVDNRVKVKARNNEGWINVADIQAERVLEVNFVDIGQGDGCHIVTPANEHILIDAGKGDNMNRYITWRFNLYKKTQAIDLNFKAIISHSDEDHYGGFADIFKNKALLFTKIYHQGIVERAVAGEVTLGEIENDHIVGLVKDTAAMKAIITDPAKLTGKGSTYAKTLAAGLANNPNVEFKMLNVDDDYVEQFEKTNKVNAKELSMRILGPIPKKMPSGKKGLKSLKNNGKDKNGHSVILKLNYGKLRLLLGGDLNEEFGKIIYKHYKDKNQLADLVMDAAKSCHHGSNHFDLDFLKTVNATATVISSGDDEPFSHPRPDTLGAIGKCGHGDRPLIFSTELARSNKEITRKNLLNLNEWRAEIEINKKTIKDLNLGNTADKLEIVKKLNDKNIKSEQEINSFLTRFGMINLRSDGERMIIAQKYERDAPTGKWDIHELIFDAQTDRFELQL
jgi:beta-lactamase superfamily II metal-dependent hydrolase